MEVVGTVVGSCGLGERGGGAGASTIAALLARAFNKGVICIYCCSFSFLGSKEGAPILIISVF